MNHMKNNGLEDIQQFYHELNRKPVYADNPFIAAAKSIFAPKDSIVISDSKYVRGIAKVRHLERVKVKPTAEKALRFLALFEALRLLQKKGIPVLFYNRIGDDKQDNRYTVSEKKRIDLNLDFPKMYEDINRYQEDLKDIFGEKYSYEYVSAIGKIPQVVRIDDRYCHEDCKSNLINVINGYRVVPGQPREYKTTIHMYGRCGVFGYAVEDADCLPSLLQKNLVLSGHKNIRVLNHGLWGGEDGFLDHNFIHDAVGMQAGDAVIFYRKNYDERIMHVLKECGVYCKDFTEEWHNQRGDEVTFYNQPGHMNAEGYRLVAQFITKDIIDNNLLDLSANTSEEIHVTHIKKYLKDAKDDHFQNEIYAYVNSIISQYPTDHVNQCGAIVMNCNPFTKGHRYLIETAAKTVDRLYIFVVEENKSYFSFEDRFEMVKRGTADINNIAVLPSGKFIISAYTFPEYFMKDYVKEKQFDISYDIETFCRYIAPPLKILIRFAGEEPYDPVTSNYNDNMKKLLPQYGIEFREIPRLKNGSGKEITATDVRKILTKDHYQELMELIPQTTYDVIFKDN